MNNYHHSVKQSVTEYGRGEKSGHQKSSQTCQNRIDQRRYDALFSTIAQILTSCVSDGYWVPTLDH